MIRLFQSYATPLVTGLFVVSLISGLALFFHIGPSGFHGMHEWLSLVLIVPFVLHLWKNWRPMTAYFRHAPMGVALAGSAVAAALFLVPLGDAAGAGGPPQFRLAHEVLSHGPAQVAPALGLTADELAARLAVAGLTVTDPEQPLTEMAAVAGKSDADLAAALLTAQP